MNRNVRTALLSTLLLINGAVLKADVISSNLSATSARTEIASGSDWLTASFGTAATAATLSSVTLLLANPAAGVAQVSLYSDGLFAPGSLVAVLTSPSTYSTGLTDLTFSTGGILLATNSTYWIVLSAVSGEFDWSWTNSSSGSGTGFQGTWGEQPGIPTLRIRLSSV